MRALVVGGAGFIGSHLVERLLADGAEVDVVDDLTTGSLANLADARSAGGVLKIHTLDAATDGVSTLVRHRAPDVVYHLAWWPPGIAGPASIGPALESTSRILEAARHVGTTKLVTAVQAHALYGEVPARSQPVKESQVWAPRGVRGVAARSIVELLGVYRDDHAVEFTVLAMGNVYGSRQRSDGGVVAAFVAAQRDGTAPTVDGDGRQQRDFLFIDDAVDALARAAARAGGLVVNVGTGVGTAIRDLWALVGGPTAAAPVAAPARAGSVGRVAIAPTRARIHLAWSPWTAVADGLRSL